jgi:hypothetical protein
MYTRCIPTGRAPLQVLLRFSERFHSAHIDGLLYNVRFSIKRTGFVFMHEALDVAKGGAAAGLRPELLVPPATAVNTGAPAAVRLWCTHCCSFLPHGCSF